MSDRALVAVGTFGADTVRCVEEAAAAVSALTVVVEGHEDAPAKLSSLDPVGIVLQTDTFRADQTCAHIRAQARLAHVPILGVAHERSDLAFTEIFSWGGDDLVGLATPDSLARRLRCLAGRAPTSTPETLVRESYAVIAGADARWRRVMARVLYTGGFAVRFAATAADLDKECIGDAVRVIVARDDLAPGGVTGALGRARAKGSETPWVIITPPKHMAAAHAAVASLGHVAVADGFAPPENVIFLSNELLTRRGVDQRASPRLLYGTRVAFRPAGRDEDEIGFAYNVSAGGVYVRTLAPLDANQEVWLEMWPPRSERRVRLVGKVAWKRPFGPNERATVPPGFGVCITAGLGDDLTRWRTGYDAYAETILGARRVAHAGPS